MRTAYRPKHQSLILKCYPALPKDSAAKPNPSELSYLLYYASTRRSKLQKVGKFLEKRTASDVWRLKPGNVHVTLEICKALIDKCPRDLNLYASSILTVLHTILGSKDINLTEDTIPCFESFCAHHDGANLSSDSEFVRQFEEIIKLYADCATSSDAKLALRWRSIGLQAIKCVASSEALSTAPDARSQLAIITPAILRNVYSESEDHLLTLQLRVNNLDAEEAEGGRPRLSLSTVATNITDAAVVAAAGTAEAADRLEEEDIGVLALQSLKRIFEVNNTAQIRYATAAVLEFVTSKPDISETWAQALLEMIARWAPVQYRHLILITCQETLVRLPMTEEALPKQLILAHLISWLLASTVNLIGLSVMDVLLSFINHILRLLQLEKTTKGSSARNPPVPEQEQDAHSVPNIVVFNQDSNSQVYEVTPTNSSDVHKELLHKLTFCVGNLGNHIYYSDQIADIITEILVRLKPGSSSPITSALDPQVAGAATSNLSEKQGTDEFFSFATARKTALKCVKEILVIANGRGGAQSGVGRSGVPLSVWDGTTWLLREEDRGVRKAYVDALTTYLKLEADRSTITSTPGSPKKTTLPPLDKGSNTFIKLLHVAIYESALQYTPDTVDMLSLHLLLTRLVQKLGISAVASGLPMIYKLQSDLPTLTDRKAQVAVSSLVAGYLLTVGEIFGLEDLREGVGMEITHRKEHGQWFDGIKFPPEDVPLTPAYPPDKNGYISSDPILPFDNRFAVVNDICDAITGSSPDNRSPIVFTRIKDCLLAEWSKEAVITELETHSSRQTSVSESRHGAGAGTLKNFLTVNGNNGNGRPGSLNGSHHHQSRPGSKHGAVGATSAGAERFRVRSQTTGGSTTRSSSSRSWTVKVDDLKAVLTGQPTDFHHGGHAVDDSSSSASECQSYNSSDGEELIIANGGAATGGSGRFSLASSHGNGQLNKKRSSSMHSRRDTVGSDATITGYYSHDSHTQSQSIPPVPKLPAMMDIPGAFPGGEEDLFTSRAIKENGHSKAVTPIPAEDEPSSPILFAGYKSAYNHTPHTADGLRPGPGPGPGRLDVQSVLSSIDSTKKRPGSSRGLFKPPY